MLTFTSMPFEDPTGNCVFLWTSKLNSSWFLCIITLGSVEKSKMDKIIVKCMNCNTHSHTDEEYHFIFLQFLCRLWPFKSSKPVQILLQSQQEIKGKLFLILVLFTSKWYITLFALTCFCHGCLGIKNQSPFILVPTLFSRSWAWPAFVLMIICYLGVCNCYGPCVCGINQALYCPCWLSMSTSAWAPICSMSLFFSVVIFGLVISCVWLWQRERESGFTLTSNFWSKT